MNILNFTLLNVNRELVQRLTPVTVLDTFEGATKNFHPDGLYSVDIFGPIASERRDEAFSYIDINAEIISPVIALTLFDLKRLYKDVMSSKRFAVWDAQEKDFLPAAPGDEGADTGYSFFMSHYKELSPRATNSLIRQQSIDLLNKFRDIALSRYVLVLPAGLRDLVVKETGREQEDELGKMYRKLISTSKMIPNVSNKNHKSLDTVRWTLQNAFIEIYKYFFNLEDGKYGFIRGKWAARRVINGTRNVISSMDATSPVMGRGDEIRATDTIVGMIQGLRCLLPVAIHAVRTRYLPNVDAGNGSLYLIDKKSGKREMVFVKPEDYDQFTTDEGIENLIVEFRHREKKHEPITINGKYLALIWNDGTRFKVFFDISELPEGFDKKYVKPMTYCELLYLSGYDKWNNYYGLVTRYPVTGSGSTYSSTIRLVTTVQSSMVYELDEMWNGTLPKPATAFPNRNVEEFVTSMAPNPTRINGLGADFDGDTASFEGIYTDESLEENRRMINSAAYWVTPDGSLKVDVANDIQERTLHNLLADPK